MVELHRDADAARRRVRGDGPHHFDVGCLLADAGAEIDEPARPESARLLDDAAVAGGLFGWDAAQHLYHTQCTVVSVHSALHAVASAGTVWGP